MFDVSKLATGNQVAECTVPMVFIDPVDGEKTKAIWQIRSYNSDDYKKRLRALKLEALRKQAAARNQTVEPTEADLEKVDVNAAELMAVLVASWEGMGDDDKDFPCTFKNVFELTSNSMWGDDICTQIEKVANNNKAFFEASKIKSPTLSNTDQDT